MEQIIKEEFVVPDDITIKQEDPCEFKFEDYKTDFPIVKNEILDDDNYKKAASDEKNWESKALARNNQQYKVCKTRNYPFVCMQCWECFQVMPKLLLHIKKHDSEQKIKKYGCLICNKMYVNRGGLAKHIKTHTGNLPKPKFRCDLCSRKFDAKRNLLRHIHSHLGIKPHQCKGCLKTYRNKSSLKYHRCGHVRRRKRNGNLNNCSRCRKNFTSNKILNEHLILDNCYYGCNYCDATFNDKTRLKYHIMKHMNEWPHKCSYCGKGFILLADLTVHVRSHTGETPYICQICNKGFKQNSKLTRHMIVHTKEKAHGCSVCGMRFSYSWGLTSHLRTEHED